MRQRGIPARITSSPDADLSIASTLRRSTLRTLLLEAAFAISEAVIARSFCITATISLSRNSSLARRRSFNMRFLAESRSTG
jgi:hypothetical protein